MRKDCVVQDYLDNEEQDTILEIYNEIGLCGSGLFGQ